MAITISCDWLGKYVDLSNVALDELCYKLTMAGIEVEGIEALNQVPEGVVTARILERKPHENSDHLSVCQVSDGENTYQVVCGAPNCDAGNIVPLATLGTVFKDKEGEFVIKKSKLRGVESQGMMCSADEIGVGGDHDGLLIFSEDTPVGVKVGELFKADTRLELEVTPNRPDWLSHWGIARDVSCLLSRPAVLPEIKIPAGQGQAKGNLVTIEDKELCTRYIGRVVRNVKVAESPKWLQDALRSIGLRPINNVVDITNFVMMELGQPLHAFDLANLAEERVVVRRANEGEELVTLDGSKLKLAPRHLVICDALKPVALAGVMGGEFSGVSEKTTDVLLESAVFFKSNIRATSRELGISTDSSYRFERGVDWDGARLAADRAVQLLCEIAGGTPEETEMDVYEARPEEQVITCRFAKINALIGVALSADEIMAILSKLALKVTAVDADHCLVTVPLFRLDLEREADLAEEVARINGLENVPEVPVMAKMVSSISDDAYWPLEGLRNQLVQLGLYECVHYSMVKESAALLDRRFTKEDLIELSNPLSLDLAYMRPSLWSEMLNTVERNIARRNLNLQLFEIGRAFCANPKLFPEERTSLIMVQTGCKHPERYSSELSECFDFYDFKGLVEELMDLRGVPSYRIVPAEDARFVKGRTAKLEVAGKTAGFFGEVARDQSKGWRTTYPVFAGEFEVDLLLNAPKKSEYYRPFSVYPATARDIAMVADNQLSNDDIVIFIKKQKPADLEKIELFDLFENPETIGEGKRSLAYRLTFRNFERTLNDDEVNRTVGNLREALSNKLKVELR